MSCTVSFTYGPNARPITKGTPPRVASDWIVRVWLVLPSLEKITHSATIANVQHGGIKPALDQIVDGLIKENGNEVTSCGWLLTSVAKRKKKRR